MIWCIVWRWFTLSECISRLQKVEMQELSDRCSEETSSLPAFKKISKRSIEVGCLQISWLRFRNLSNFWLYVTSESDCILFSCRWNLYLIPKTQSCFTVPTTETDISVDLQTFLHQTISHSPDTRVKHENYGFECPPTLEKIDRRRDQGLRTVVDTPIYLLRISRWIVEQLHRWRSHLRKNSDTKDTTDLPAQYYLRSPLSACALLPHPGPS